MPDVIEFIQSSISAFDLIVFLIIVYSMAQCAAKGFMRSLLSFSKWLLALIITIILVPKLENTSIEKPKIIVIEVFKIATPTVL